MSQDDQRNVPNRNVPNENAADAADAADSADTAEAARRTEAAAGERPPSGATRGLPAENEVGAVREAASPSTGAHTRETATVGGSTSGATAVLGTESPTGASPHGAARREFRDQGEGSARYAAPGEPTPPSGSEQSWSAAPHPGYQADPARNYSTKRLLASTLIGVLLLGGGVVYVYRIVTNRSGNGFGAAPWTAAVKHNGAYVGGINAQNNGAAQPVDLAKGAAYGSNANPADAAITSALAACHTATGVTVPVSTATGTKAAIDGWSARATPSVQALRTDAIGLQTALNGTDAVAVANAAQTLCSAYPGIAALPPLPDAAGSQAWSSAVTSFATAATESLRGAAGNPDATAAAIDNINQGDKQLNALSTRISTAT